MALKSITSDKASSVLATALGKWLDSGLRNVPRGELTWTGVPRRAYTASVGVEVVATIRCKPFARGWAARMPGFEWDLSGEAGNAFHKQFGISSSPVRVFKTSTEAKRAIEAAYGLLLLEQSSV